MKRFNPSLRANSTPGRSSSRRARAFSVAALFAGGALLATADRASAAAYGMTASDAGGTSSFTSPLTANGATAAAGFRLNSSAANPSTAASAGNTYATNAFILRGPANGNSYNFAGDSLTVSAAAGSRFLIKATGATQVLTINNLILAGGYIDNGGASNDNTAATIAGAISVTGSSGFGAAVGETLVINSTLSGTGSLTIAGATLNNNVDNGLVILGGSNTGYTGTITVNGSNGGGGTGITATNVLSVLALNNLNSVAGATLTLSTSTANGVAFLAGANTGTFNVGALAGAANEALTDTAGAAVAVSVGGSNVASTTYSGILSGAGSLTKTGTGTLILSGANTYTGGTTVNAGGTLQIGAGAAAGSVAGDITDNGTLAFSRSDTVAYAGVVSGSGALTKLGGGTLGLSGANTYTGTTTISAGILQIGAGGTTGSLSPSSAIVDNATFSFNRPGTTVTQGTDFASVISGTGLLSQIGANSTLVLNGANTYGGQTSIFGGGSLSASTLNSVMGGTASSNLGTPSSAENGTIILGGNSAIGTLVYTGAGETSDRAVRLQAASAGSNGVLDQSGTGPLVFSGGITSQNSATHVITLQGSTAAAGEISGVISNGSGLALTKAGTGTWTLSNTNNFAGATTVNGGSLAVSATGALGGTSGVTINADSTLLLSGSAGVTDRINNSASLTINSGGTFHTSGLKEGVDPTNGNTAAAGVGALTLQGGATINLGIGSSVGSTLFAATGAINGAGTISILNWSSDLTGVVPGQTYGDSGATTNDRLLFTIDPTFSAAQLGQIAFYSDSGTFLGNATEISYNGLTELVPVAVPEPSTWAAGLLGLGLLGYAQRSRVSNWLRVRRAA